MNKQFLVSVVVMFILSLGLGFVVHELMLKNDYNQLPNLMRKAADAQRHFPAMLAAHACIAIGMTAIYRRGREAGKGWTGQGVRFGLLFAVAVCLPTYLIYYAVQPMPLTLVVKQLVFDTITTVLLGIAVAGLNKQAA